MQVMTFWYFQSILLRCMTGRLPMYPSLTAMDLQRSLGAELHAPKTQVGELWHILATGLPRAFAAAGENESAAQLAARASKAGAFISIAHPSWSQLSLDDGLSINCADSVEIYNHGCEVESDRGYGWYLLDQLNNLGKRLNAIATDDAHFADGDADAFGGWINVKSVSLNAESLLKALKTGDFYSSQGPQIHNVDLEKAQLTINCSPVDRITVVSGTSRTVTKRGKSISQASIDLEDLNEGWLLDQPSDWFRIVIRDSAGHKAWTNPYWFEDL